MSDMPEPGIYPAMPAKDYFAVMAASKSILWEMQQRSALHANAKITRPDNPTPAMRQGRLIHTCVLEHDRWLAEVIRGPEGKRTTKAAKDAWATAILDHRDSEVILPADYDLAMVIREAVADHPRARRLVEGRVEQSLFWDDPDTGVRCKARIDMVSESISALIDLKSARDASPRAFARAIWEHGYYIQGAHYLSGAQEVGIPRKNFIFVVVEKTPPYGVATYDLEEQALLAGYGDLSILLRRWRECMESDVWPGYSDRVEPINLPPYAWAQIEERQELAALEGEI